MAIFLATGFVIQRAQFREVGKIAQNKKHFAAKCSVTWATV